jgi:hypothetical protein
MIYQRVALPRKVVWSTSNTIRFQSVERAYAPDADPAAILASSGDQDSIALVTKKAAEQNAEAARAADILYVVKEVDSDEACKIGYTCQPTFRLMQLQVSTWRELTIAAAFCPVKANIPALEKAVHDEAKARGLWLRGEWIRLAPVDAVALIMDVASNSRRLLCGCDVWFENLAARVAGLRKEQLAMRQRALDLQANINIQPKISA